MKKLIFPLIFLCISAFAQDEILSDSELKNKLISVVKEVQVENVLEKSEEVQRCKAKAKFDPGKTNSQESIQKAIECFQEELSKNKDPEAIKKLSDALGLQSYGLVSTNNNKEITKFLSNKLYKSLTGVDKDQKDLKALMEQMKFKNRKQVDQRDFFKLYKAQMMKNTLYEISRFCFENFRLDSAIHPGKSEASFKDHWSGNLRASYSTDEVTDTGTKGFDLNNLDTSSNDSVYEHLLTNLGANDDQTVKAISKFFDACSMQIIPLCKIYEKDKGTKGANACLSKAKLQNAKKALASLTEFEKEAFDKLDPTTLELQLANVTHFELKGETSVDNLTSYSSKDILDAKVVGNDKASECATNPSGPDCEAFLVVDDSLKKIEHDMDLDYQLKREAEVARVKAIKEQGNQKLEEYLEANGYFELIAEYKDNNYQGIETAIANIFDARKKAALADLKKKVGSRQMSESDASPEKKRQNIQDNAKATKEERARLAQVIMFNNIITSSIGLSKVDSSGNEEQVGQNIGGLLKETNDLKNTGIDQNLFQNLRQTVDNAKGMPEEGGMFGEFSILDKILGKSSDSPNPKD